MHPDLTNLLPEDRSKLLRSTYFLRLSTVAVSVGALLVFIAALLLIPTYLFLSKEESTRADRLASIKQSLASADETALSARLNALSSDAETLSVLGQTPSGVSILQKLLAVSRPGVVLTSILYTPAGEKTQGALTISGIAATRDALRSYQLALQGSSFAKSADLPVSAYAKDSDIPFAIKITLQP